MSQPTICDHCKNPEDPLTPTNSEEFFQRDAEYRKIPGAIVHLSCAEQWLKKHNGIRIEDEPPPAR